MPASITQRHAVLAMVRAAEQHAALLVDPDRLAAAKRIRRQRRAVAAPREILAHAALDGGLERQHALDAEAARAVRGLLRIVAAIEHLRQEMGVAGRLELPAHDAEG